MSTPVEAPAIGSRLDAYSLTGLIGKGGMSTVYLAEEEGTGRKVALKVLEPRLHGDQEFRERFLREARYAAELRHPNVVHVQASGESGGLLYMAMDYVEGTDLHTLVALEGKLDGLRALGILAPIASALDAAHATGLLHRDVNPSNILIEPAKDPADLEEAYLTDFGLSKNRTKDSRGLTAAGAFVGTFSYTAPEQILDRQPDHHADIYSLGCVLFECLTGGPPFQNHREAMVLHGHIEEPPPKVTASRPDLPPAIDAVLERALAKSPGERFVTCTEMIAAARVALTASRPASAPLMPPTVEATPAPAAVPATPAPAAPAAAVPAGAALLRVIAGNAAGDEIALDDELLIGRHATGAGQLSLDGELSRKHARVVRRPDGGYAIEDLGSKNGTFVNGTRITELCPLSEGDTIEVGSTKLVLAAGEPDPARGPSGSVDFALAPNEPTPLGSPSSLATAAVTGNVSLRLDIDFDARTARLEVGEAAEAVVLVFDGVRWQPSS